MINDKDIDRIVSDLFSAIAPGCIKFYPYEPCGTVRLDYHDDGMMAYGRGLVWGQWLTDGDGVNNPAAEYLTDGDGSLDILKIKLYSEDDPHDIRPLDDATTETIRQRLEAKLSNYMATQYCKY